MKQAIKGETDRFEHYGKLALNCFLAHIIFLVVFLLIFPLPIKDGEGSGMILGFFILFSISLYAPVNTLVIVLLYIFNINKFLLRNLWYVVAESLFYVFLSMLLVFSPTFDFLNDFLKNFIPDGYLFLSPYIIIIPVFAIQGYYIKRRRRRKELAGTVPAINPDDGHQTKQTDKK